MLTEKDKEDLKTAIDIGVDYLAVSFPRSGADMQYARELLGEAGQEIGLVAKIERAEAVAVQLDCGAVNINDVISNLMCTTAPMGGWKSSGMGVRFGGAEGIRKFCRQEAVVAPRTNVGAGGNYYNKSLRALKRMNTMMTKMALVGPRRAAK